MVDLRPLNFTVSIKSAVPQGDGSGCSLLRALTNCPLDWWAAVEAERYFPLGVPVPEAAPAIAASEGGGGNGGRLGAGARLVVTGVPGRLGPARDGAEGVCGPLVDVGVWLGGACALLERAGFFEGRQEVLSFTVNCKGWFFELSISWQIENLQH